MADALLVVNCPEHGLHGQREDCFVCRGPVEQVPVVRAVDIAAVLSEHVLIGIVCDHERSLDNPVCGCSLVNLGWHPSVGQARQAWVDHVLDQMGVR